MLGTVTNRARRAVVSVTIVKSFDTYCWGHRWTVAQHNTILGKLTMKKANDDAQEQKKRIAQLPFFF
jgi:hypothetical protein